MRYPIIFLALLFLSSAQPIFAMNSGGSALVFPRPAAPALPRPRLALTYDPAVTAPQGEHVLQARLARFWVDATLERLLAQVLPSQADQLRMAHVLAIVRYYEAHSSQFDSNYSRDQMRYWLSYAESAARNNADWRGLATLYNQFHDLARRSEHGFTDSDVTEFRARTIAALCRDTSGMSDAHLRSLR